MSAATMYMTLLSQRSGVSISVVSDPTVNVAPVIDAVPDVTPAVWSSGASDTVRWEMADTDAGPWSTVSDMPAIDTPYTDQTFGKVLRWVEAQGGFEAVSEATEPVAEVPVQSLTAKVPNPDMNWSAGALSNWTIVSGTLGGDPGYSEVAADGTAGTGAVRILSTATNNSPILRVTSAFDTLGAFFEVFYTISQRTAAFVTVRAGITGTLSVSPSFVGSQRLIVRNQSANDSIEWRGSTGVDLVADYLGLNRITLNTQLVAPSADMRISFFYTLPASPVNGDQVWVLPRISDFATGNYWKARLIYTGSQWNINLYSVALHVDTSVASATNIGTTNGIRVTMDGDQVSLFTTVNSGAGWTQRDTTKTSALYQSATGVNVLYASTVTPGEVAFANP
jgi:hypothetical protein